MAHSHSRVTTLLSDDFVPTDGLAEDPAFIEDHRKSARCRRKSDAVYLTLDRQVSI